MAVIFVLELKIRIMKSGLSIAFLFIGSLLFGQGFEAGIMVGASNYLGDLSANSSKVYLQESHLAGGIFGRLNIGAAISVKLGVNYAKISGNDQNATNPGIRERNLNFRSNLYEASLTGEWNILGYNPYNYYRTFSPYVFGGIALYQFNPKTDYLGASVALQTLGTEGQGLSGFEAPYQLTQLAIPMGIGFKFALNDLWNLGLEIGARKTFTDYLDDVSTDYISYFTLLDQSGELTANLSSRTWEFYDTEPGALTPITSRGDDDPSDWYFIMGLSISYNFSDNGLVGSRSNNRRRTNCTTF